jgi:hypothetical protein
MRLIAGSGRKDASMGNLRDWTLCVARELPARGRKRPRTSGFKGWWRNSEREKAHLRLRTHWIPG